MKLFIIGNGFDQGHLLPTKYEHFRDYLEKENWAFLTKLEAPYGFVPESREDFVKELLWKDFESNLSNVNEAEIVDGALSIDMGLEGGDVDIEDTLNQYWREQYEYIRHLNDYVYEWVKQVNIDIPKKTKYIDNTTDDLFLTFNYTLVLEKVYEVEPYQILHIHGSVNAKEYGPPIIGHGNDKNALLAKEKATKASENYWEKESSIYRTLAEYYQETRKDVNYFINSNSGFFKRLHNVEAVNVIGHSLGEVDMPYFRKVLQNTKSNTLWNIYYHSEEEKDVLFQRALQIGIKEENIRPCSTKEFYVI